MLSAVRQHQVVEKSSKLKFPVDNFLNLIECFLKLIIYLKQVFKNSCVTLCHILLRESRIYLVQRIIFNFEINKPLDQSLRYIGVIDSYLIWAFSSLD